MNVGIVGLPQSGKTTVFNAATRGSADLAAYAGEAKANVGVARVPDARLAALAEVFSPKRTVAAEIGYVDAPSSGEPSDGLVPPAALDELRGVDALAIVVRAFDDADAAGPVRDAEEALLELALTDAGVLERRLTRIAEGSKGLRAAERDALDRERALVLRVKDGLENGAAVADQKLTEDESRVLGGFGLMTSKPVVVVLNTGEGPTEQSRGGLRPCPRRPGRPRPRGRDMRLVGDGAGADGARGGGRDAGGPRRGRARPRGHGESRPGGR